ncbi:hypothetical protein ACIGZJ_06075 [Kitasatospora sp. NPDC052868]|uniref:hypothetical protein n=1 Tax=Kitasatospora sp. NPDC052868 TaxID=3364060 RepID=UPI0037C6C144
MGIASRTAHELDDDDLDMTISRLNNEGYKAAIDYIVSEVRRQVSSGEFALGRDFPDILNSTPNGFFYNSPFGPGLAG